MKGRVERRCKRSRLPNFIFAKNILLCFLLIIFATEKVPLIMIPPPLFRYDYLRTERFSILSLNVLNGKIRLLRCYYKNGVHFVVNTFHKSKRGLGFICLLSSSSSCDDEQPLSSLSLFLSLSLSLLSSLSLSHFPCLLSLLCKNILKFVSFTDSNFLLVFPNLHFLRSNC